VTNLWSSVRVKVLSEGCLVKYHMVATWVELTRELFDKNLETLLRYYLYMHESNNQYFIVQETEA